MPRSTRALLVLFAASAAAPSPAAVLLTLSNVTFNDGGTASGSFTVDNAGTTVLAYSITTSAGTFFQGGQPGSPTSVSVPAFTYQPSTASASLGGLVGAFDTARFTSFGPADQQRVLQLRVGGPITAGGTLTVFGEGIFLNGRNGVTGSLVAQAVSDPVPEPATWGTMILGFGLAGATLRRRRSVAAAA